MDTDKNRWKRTGIRLRGMLAPISLLTIWVLSGCAPGVGQAATPMIRSRQTIPASPTTTVIWFPATSTPTLPPTSLPATTTPVPPTPDAGSLIFSDDFTNKALWLSGEFDAGTIAYGNRELDLAISQARGTLTSRRMEPVLTNFYLVIDVTPSLCLNNDNFGILFRMADSSNFYRYIQACNGQLRLERLKDGVGQVLHDWSASPQAVPKINGAYKLGIWAYGNDLRFYIDGVLQFSVKDASLESGGLGVFARSMGDNPVTVGFSNLEVYQPENTRLPTTAPSPTPTS